MRRKKHTTDARFGSDAFLDVMSNMVGILVILVVVAGMQLGGQPLVEPIDAPPAPSAVEPPPGAALPGDLAPGSAAEPPLPQAEPAAQGPAGPSPELVAELDRLERLMQENSQRRAAEVAQLEQAVELHNAMVGKVKESRSLLARETTVAQRIAQQVAGLEADLGQRRQKLTGLLAEFEQARRAQSPAVEIKHRITPISQEIMGEELHFRLKNNQVSAVPLKLLIERVKQQVERHREVAVMRGGYKGVVGPIDGYSLEFLVEARRLSAIEERRLGFQEGYSLDLSHCTVLPLPGLVGETAEEALRRNSRFATALRAAPDGAALTFWTYPDSFALFRKLQEVCHAEGFIVAGRPLPEGTPIAGNRRGTRSAGQ